MHTTLLSHHESACNQLSILITQASTEDHEERAQIQTNLEKYAAIAQKMLSILEKLTDHERTLQALSAELTPAIASEEHAGDIQWDMLIRHAQQQLDIGSTLPKPQK
jgi:multidrug resistance efflux pump